MSRASDRKKNELLNAAGAVFRSVGYDRASMNAISERFGGSKATLYAYFTTKAALFEAWIARESAGLRAPSCAALDIGAGADTVGALTQFGTECVKYALSSGMLELKRAAVSHADVAPAIAFGRRQEAHGFDACVAAFLGRRLPPENRPPGGWTAAARQFRALLTAETIDRLVCRSTPAVSQEEAAVIAHAAATVIVRSYA